MMSILLKKKKNTLRLILILVLANKKTLGNPGISWIILDLKGYYDHSINY